ncbi:hypothetical protein DYB26_007856 [Aphanomyces astaci]|uniref:B box-type domain-containing protein n=1 Tax=Aphanomyces astaci TaxID=112090 RepID=A0A3R7EB10_APHAT|nr:hypothetical protein DYB26_007856 [Aphanomyces astaci]
MLGRWGDFDSDVLLNANLAQEDHAYLDVGGGTEYVPRRHTADEVPKPKPRDVVVPHRATKTAVPPTSTLAPPSLSRQSFHHVNAKCAMFAWMLESDSLRHTVFDALTPVWEAAKVAAGHSTIMSPHVFDLVAQRLAKRYGGTILPLHGVVKERHMHAAAFCTIVASMMAPVVTHTTIPECLFAVQSLVDEIVVGRRDGSIPVFRSMDAIEPVQYAPTLALPPLSKSTLATQEDQLKQKLRLRKYWSAQASDTAACILPDEIPLFHRESMRSRAKASREFTHGPQDDSMHIDTTRTRSNLDAVADTTHRHRLQDPFPIIPMDDVQDDSSGDDDRSMALVCARCEVNEAVLWCSQCYTITCILCWSASHSTPIPTTTIHDTAPLRGCIHTQSLTSLQQGPPLPLLRTPRPSPQVTTTEAMRHRRKKPSCWTPKHGQSKLQAGVALHVANSLPPRVVSSVDHQQMEAAAITGNFDPTAVADDSANYTRSSTIQKPRTYSVVAHRHVLRHHAVDLNATMLPHHNANHQRYPIP